MIDIRQNELILKPIKLVSLFTLLGVLFWYLPTENAHIIWGILDVCAVGWLAIEVRGKSQKDLGRAIEIGIFLMIFDFIVENIGKVLGLWETYNSIFFVGAVPIEVMLLALAGGTAWALYQPHRFYGVYTFVNILIFATFGTIGEYIIAEKGLMVYMGGWTSLHAFFGYVLTWMILHSIVYFRFQRTAPSV